MTEQQYDYGMIGLGTMGRNLVLNISDHGYSVAGFDKSDEQVAALKQEADNREVNATTQLSEFVKALKLPRVILLLVPAGKIVDEVITEVKPLLTENDLIVDCGNSHFSDTNKRIEELSESGIYFIGVGVSGGESGARFGPSIMPGGAKNIYERIAPMLESIAAKVNDEPCVAWLGEGSAGHYVKMVHNGIEYGLMQLISEAYHILKQAGGLSNTEIHQVFSKWNDGKLHSFLIEITADIFKQKDEFSDSELVDVILDAARQKGTGGWTSEDAMKLQVPIPVIDIAVSMRGLSAYKKDRETAQQKLAAADAEFSGNKTELTDWLEQALYFSSITTYAQGMALLHTASATYKYDLQLENIAKIWRGGCIIRATLLEDIRAVFSLQHDLQNILLSDTFALQLKQAQSGMRKVVQMAAGAGIPIPALMGSLAYYDSYRSGWLPANLVQAQRDYFGAHTYQRTDREGVFHTKWNQKND